MSVIAPEKTAQFIFNFASQIVSVPNINFKIDFGSVQLPDKIMAKCEGDDQVIEIDFPNLEFDKLYLVNYQNDNYAVKKISEHEFVFYDVIQ